MGAGHQKQTAMEEILNIEYHHRRLTLKALNVTKTKGAAAKLLGISERQVYRLIRIFDIRQISPGHYMIEDKTKKLSHASY